MGRGDRRVVVPRPERRAMPRSPARCRDGARIRAGSEARWTARQARPPSASTTACLSIRYAGPLRATSGKSTARLRRAGAGDLSQLRDIGDGGSPLVLCPRSVSRQRSGEGPTVGRLSRVAQLRGSDPSQRSSAHLKSDHLANGIGDHLALECKRAGNGVIDTRGGRSPRSGVQVRSAGVSRVGSSASMSPSDWARGSSVNTRRR